MSELILCCVEGKKNPPEILSKSPDVKQSLRAVPGGKGRPASLSVLKHRLSLTVHLDPLIQRKSTPNLNMNMKIEDVHLFS